MHREFLVVAALTFAGPLFAAERAWDFSQMATNQPPIGCFSTVAGEGKPGDWKVGTDEFPQPLQPINGGAPKTYPKAVVAQLGRDYADNHFPLLVLGEDTYADFVFKTKFKIVDGLTEQSAGIAFRVQDERNFYFVRLDAVANKISVCGMLKGAQTTLYSTNGAIQKGAWHDLTVEFTSDKMHIGVDGEFLPWIKERTFSAGKIAYWTKSDSISYFTDTRIIFTPRETFAQIMVRDVMKENPRLIGVKVFMVPPRATNEIRLVASNDEKEVGEAGDKTDADVIGRGVNYYRKDKERVYVTMPLRDRNGDAVAAVHFVMKSFPGQTEENALIRATPLIKKMQQRAAGVDSLN